MGIQEAVNKAGGQSKLAAKIGVTRGYVHKMLKSGHVPSGQVVAIEAATGVARDKLRPDLYK